MKILETRVMRGPNQWSDTQRNLIILKVYAEEVNEDRFNNILDSHPEIFSGFKSFQATEHAPRIVQLLQYLACDLQTRAGMPCNYSRVKSTGKPDEFFLIYSYVIEQA